MHFQEVKTGGLEVFGSSFGETPVRLVKLFLHDKFRVDRSGGVCREPVKKAFTLREVHKVKAHAQGTTTTSPRSMIMFS